VRSASGGIVSDKSDAALIEFMKELRGILGARRVTDDELSVAEDALIQRLPSTFESVTSIDNALTTLWTQGLPDDYYQQYAKSIGAITKDDVLRVAKKYIDVDRLAIVIGGDRNAIEAPLETTKVAPIVHDDIDGNPAR
jgi:zinc protease